MLDAALLERFPLLVEHEVIFAGFARRDHGEAEHFRPSREPHQEAWLVPINRGHYAVMVARERRKARSQDNVDLF
jgi:hypothetical protein